MNKPNHICKNPDCRAAYFWCDGCHISKDDEWGKVGCCPECAQIYWDLIEKSRSGISPEEDTDILCDCVSIPDLASEELGIETEIVEQTEQFVITSTKPKRKAKTVETEA